MERAALTYKYNMLNQVCKQHSIDSGNSFTLTDVAGQPFYAWDAAGRQFKMIYDELRRPVEKQWGSTLLEQTLYGETYFPQGYNPKTLNLRGQIFEHRGGSGKQWMQDGYDLSIELLS